MEEITTKKVLEHLLLPIGSSWQIVGVRVVESEQSVYVELGYKDVTLEVDGIFHSIYDHRTERCWRHLDLWQYKTYLSARVPRYKDDGGKVHSITVPWAESKERITTLLEKKR